MTAMGFESVRLTPSGADGGLDVVGDGVAAQVKALGRPVGRPDVQKLVGAAHARPHRLFFSSSGYTPHAVQYADIAGVALFLLDAHRIAQPVNAVARNSNS